MGLFSIQRRTDGRWEDLGARTASEPNAVIKAVAGAVTEAGTYRGRSAHLADAWQLVHVSLVNGRMLCRLIDGWEKPRLRAPRAGATRGAAPGPVAQ